MEGRRAPFKMQALIADPSSNMDSSTTDPGPSPRAMSLARELVRVVRERRAQESHLTWPEVVDAMDLVRRELSTEFGSNEARVRLLVAVLFAVGLTAASAIFLLSR